MLLQRFASLQFWLVILLGLSHFGTRIEARAVNVSNTWTMPQEGLNVFYRFFRDRISWFEADAVCQFHHANLVTVDNSFQFDATRDLLRELDVNDIVWIGLMRPQSSERFMWSNSRPLVTDTGYWAESLPLMDAPLCAVIDPIRDYRWHALRCGGPETASFLCEMPVPSWADACILKDMPNLTMQYMADTASIELIRNCAEEGLLKQSCKGKQDRDRALQELICPRERLEAQRINDITNSHFKSLQIINSIRTDNNENNDIELLPLGETSYGSSSSSSDISEQVQTEKNTVQRLIEQFNVDELMQADEAAMPVSNYHIPGEIPKPVKKSAKKVIVSNGGEYPKKYVVGSQKSEEGIQLPPPTPKPSKQQQMLALEDMMMGDQPQQSGEPEMMEHVGPEEDEVSNEITEPLPHMKKVLPQDLKTMAPIIEKSSEEAQSGEKFAHKSAKNMEMEKRAFSTTSAVTAKPTTISTATTTSTTTTSTPLETATSSSTVMPILAASTTTAKAKEIGIETTVTTQPAPHRATSTTAANHSPSATPALATVASHGPVYTSNTPIAHTSTKLTDFDGSAFASESSPTIGHPMHPQQQQQQQPQQQRGNTFTEESQHPHVKESVDNSHFIPPMLLVKSHYVPPLKHSEHSGAEHHGIGAHGGGSFVPIGHEDHSAGEGKPSDDTSHLSGKANHAEPTTTATTKKTDETEVEAMTTITVTTTMAAPRSTATTTTADKSAHFDKFTKKTNDESISLEQQQKQIQKQHNSKLIDSTAVETNHHQQQQSEKEVSITGPTQAASEAQEMTEKIENVERNVATTTATTATTHVTTTPLTTVRSAVNKLHSIATPTNKLAATTTTTAAATAKEAVAKAMPATTMKSADNVMTDEIEKPVKRDQQTKEVEKLTKEMSVETTNIAVEMPVMMTVKTTTATATKTDEFQTMKVTDATHKPPLATEVAATTTTTTAAIPSESAATMTGAASTTSLATITTTTTAAAAAAAASASVSDSDSVSATATTATHTIIASATATACSRDADMESTTAGTTEASGADEDENGKKLTRVHRTCQPHIEKGIAGKHTKKHHATTAEPPTPTRNFMKETTETPLYKPNRHRVLTQPETVSYFKKILG